MMNWDELGLWTPVRSAAPADVSFDLNASPSIEESVWRIDLPDGPGTADHEMETRLAKLNRFDDGLSLAEQRLEKFSASTARQPGGVSFQIGDLPQPEQELLDWLNETGNRSVSFGIGETIGAKLGVVSPEFQSFLERLTDVVVHYARVETNVGGKSLGQTVVSWTGDMHTAWRAELTAEQVALHRRTLALALTSRTEYLRLLTLAARGAVMLATLPALAATPGAALIALPAAWKFIQQVIAELEQTQKYPGGFENG